MAEDQENAPQQDEQTPAEAPETASQPETEAPQAVEAPETTESAPAETQAETKPAPKLEPGKQYVWGTGRRKTSVARVRIRPGTGKFMVNKRDASDYFKHEHDRQVIMGPLEAAKMVKAGTCS